jgi:hypothetical protein
MMRTIRNRTQAGSLLLRKTHIILLQQQTNVKRIWYSLAAKSCSQAFYRLAIRSNLRFIQQDNMNARTVFGNMLKVSALTVIYFICFVIATALVSLDTGVQQNQAEQANAALILIAVCLLNTIVLAYIILCSRWSGWKLIGAMFVIIYGVVTVMPQSESAFFLTRLPAGMVPRLFISGAIVAILFSSAAILILGGFGNSPSASFSTLFFISVSAISLRGRILLCALITAEPILATC